MSFTRSTLTALISITILTLSLACSDDDPPGGTQDASQADAAPDAALDTTIRCGTGNSGSLAAGGTVAVSGAAAEDLAGAGVSAPKGATTVSVTIACDKGDLAPAGFTPLGPPVSFSPGGNIQPVDLRFTLPFKPSRLPAGAGSGSVVVFWKRGTSTARGLMLVDSNVDTTKGRVSFDLDELATFQVAINKKAGTKIKRKYAYKAIVGFSMGGGAAGVVGLRNPSRFDFIGPLGGEPGVNLLYFLNMLAESYMSGFCTAQDEAAGKGKVGQLCPLSRKPLKGQHELLMTYEKMLYQKGQGVGLTLGRSLYMRGTRDIMKAYGNPTYYNPDDPYLPPGVPSTFLSKGSTACGSPIKLEKFYDKEYNPLGTMTVITFCDGNDSSSKLGLGVFDPTIAQTQPTQLLLAVDVNGNGKRDSGEPVVVHAHEPFSDVGPDGKADAAEAGYDAAKNPDPSGDNYHYLKNPLGTEGNWRWDKGEPYEDLGIDGVKGTCQAKPGVAKCYDYGEGNSKFDWSPMVDHWLKHDPYTLYANLTEAQRERLDIWADAGIRDFLNAHVATNGLMGQVAAMGQPVRLYESFEAIDTRTTSTYFDFANVEWKNVGKNGYVRYGDPTMPAKLVESTGDGRHVGTAIQVINRTLSFFAMAQKRWPNGDREIKNTSMTGDNFKKGLTFKSPSTGQDRPFSLFLPPGYFQAENKNRTYPVVFFLHGYGQDPDDMIALSNVFANYMVGTKIKEEDRFAKFIIVYVDGRCRPGGTIPLTQTGDLCERGTFYLDSPRKGTTAKMETLLLELADHLDKTYRTKKPAEVEISYY